ncbi:YbfB/YjiJ family MFS transporter [Pseudovibrio sp. WM33]|uniref:YbfB/YjiJ family MFS transporter n=1 Tax=Pseudovibrio sp. WM33 TaxID=1735585 RepID=UPI0007AE5FF0|nr:YbfB/YjiJ family MFS transporter [Pseudovibrio sp. WM33]KZL18570.1 putative MFS family transporter protein [Pseudovibrio sp. WM33]
MSDASEKLMKTSTTTEKDQFAVLSAVGGCLAMAAVMGIGRFVYTPVLPFMLQDGTLNEVNAGFVASSNYLGYLLGALLAARAPLPGGPYRIFMIALITSTVVTFFMAFSLGAYWFVVIRFLAGLASAYAFVLVANIVMQRLAETRSLHLFPIHFTGVGIGIAGSSLMIEWLDTSLESSSQLWIASGALSLLLSLSVPFLLPPRKELHPRSTSHAIQAETTTKPLNLSAWRLIFAYGCFGFGYVITATFLGALASSTPELAPMKSLGWLLVGLAIIPSVFFWEKLAVRIGYGRAIAVACTLEAIGVALSVLTPTIAGLSAAAILLGGTFVGITSIGLVEARRLASSNPRQIVGLMTAAFGLGQMFGPSFAGYLYELNGDFLLASLVAAGALILAALLTIKRFTPA